MLKIASLSEFGADELDRDGAAEAGVAGPKYGSHAAFTQHGFDPIRSDLRARTQARFGGFGHRGFGIAGSRLLRQQCLHLAAQFGVVFARLLKKRGTLPRRAVTSPRLRQRLDLLPSFWVHLSQILSSLLDSLYTCSAFGRSREVRGQTAKCGRAAPAGSRNAGRCGWTRDWRCRQRERPRLGPHPGAIERASR